MKPVKQHLPEEEPSSTLVYQIQLQGKLDERWTDWFGGMTATFGDGVTTLTGPIADQAALRGMLSKIWDLNLALIAVKRLETGASATGEM